MPTVKETFDLMPTKFKAASAGGVNKTIQYDIGDGGGTARRQGRSPHRQPGRPRPPT
jgi:hypothetical protein